MKRALKVTRDWTGLLLLAAAGALFLAGTRLIGGPPGEGRK